MSESIKYFFKWKALCSLKFPSSRIAHSNRYIVKFTWTHLAIALHSWESELTAAFWNDFKTVWEGGRGSSTSGILCFLFVDCVDFIDGRNQKQNSVEATNMKIISDTNIHQLKENFAIRMFISEYPKLIKNSPFLSSFSLLFSLVNSSVIELLWNFLTANFWLCPFSLKWGHFKVWKSMHQSLPYFDDKIFGCKDLTAETAHAQIFSKWFLWIKAFEIPINKRTACKWGQAWTIKLTTWVKTEVT